MSSIDSKTVYELLHGSTSLGMDFPTSFKRRTGHVVAPLNKGKKKNKDGSSNMQGRSFKKCFKCNRQANSNRQTTCYTCKVPKSEQKWIPSPRTAAKKRKEAEASARPTKKIKVVPPQKETPKIGKIVLRERASSIDLFETTHSSENHFGESYFGDFDDSFSNVTPTDPEFMKEFNESLQRDFDLKAEYEEKLRAKDEEIKAKDEEILALKQQLVRLQHPMI